MLSNINTHSSFTFDFILERLSEQKGRTSGIFHSLSINSHFQPIISLAHRRSVGYEALLRCTDESGQSVSPLSLFNSISSLEETIFLDRLSRAVHIANFMRADQDGKAWLFLNLNPQVAVAGMRFGSFFEGLLQHYKIPTYRIVIEILEGRIEEEVKLADAICYYKKLGCLIAIDDFGAGSSNFDRIWRLKPDIVKLDRSMIVQASSNPQVRKIMPGMVSLLHEAGVLVIMEGIETTEEALIAMEADVDFVQGYYFARPQPYLHVVNENNQCLNALWTIYRESTLKDSGFREHEIEPYIQCFPRIVEELQKNQPLSLAAAEFLKLPYSARCYLLDKEGKQIGNNVTCGQEQDENNVDLRFMPVIDGRGASWFRRHYFRRALRFPNQVQISRPYLSINDSRHCITLSFGFDMGGETRVVCGDVDWERWEQTADTLNLLK